MDEFGYEEIDTDDEEINKPRKKGGWKVKFVIWMLYFMLGVMCVTIGLALGFFLGVVALVNVAEDLTENMTVVIEFDEEVAIDYMVTFMQEEYGDLIAAAALGKDLKLNMTNNEKIYTIVDGMDIDRLELIELDDETRKLLEEAKKNPELRDIGQTKQDFIPEELIEEMGEVELP